MYDVSRAPVQQSSGRKQIRTGSPAARRRAYGGDLSNVPCLQTPCAGSKLWEPHNEGERGRKEKREINWCSLCCRREHPSSLYIGQSGVHPSLQNQCGTIPTWSCGRGCVGRGGHLGRPLGGPRAQGATPLPSLFFLLKTKGKEHHPLMGPMWSIRDNPFYLII